MTPARPYLYLLASLTLTTALAFAAPAQTSAAAKPPEPASITRIFYVKSVTQTQDQIELVNVLRTVLDPQDRATFLGSQNAIVMTAPPDHIAAAEKLLTELDKARKAYRLTYTLIDLDGTRRLGDQHYSMIVVNGQRSVLKQGNRVPIVTGTDLKNPNSPQTQVTYVDIGMNFDASLDDSANSIRLKTKVDQSSVIEDRTGATAQDPIIRQTSFEGSAVLTPGKPLIIGSLDITGTTRRTEIQATIEPLSP
jgi:type II secretory pathway component GspD/PulD (secretin)